MLSAARAVISISLLSLPGIALAQAGPSDPQIIAAAATTKINVGPRKLAGQMVATLRVSDDGRVRDVTVIENTTENGFETQLIKVLQGARFRPAIDESGRPIESSVDMKVELRPSTGSVPKPAAAKPDPHLTEKEKVRIQKMKCSDFVWEWKLIEDEADDAAATEFMPRIAIAMYAAARTAAGEYVDAKVWKASAKALKVSAERCADSPTAPFWEGVFKPVLDEAVPK
ncbi:MAG TPA: energy transducer TonB [Steroidobacteraceae bacterium]|nr:energy transducer TonB [Steroidobacteraceae bacterium]